MAVLTVYACRDHEAGVRRSPLETGIARDLTARFGTSVTTRCVFFAGIPARCESTLADGTKLPIAIKAEGREWGWQIDGLVIEATPITDYVSGALADLGVSQGVNCGPRWRVVQAGDRIGCTLGGGGMAFVRVERDGTTSLELALDRASATARMEPVTPQREQELERLSKSLEALEGDSDGEEQLPGDGGVPSP